MILMLSLGNSMNGQNASQDTVDGRRHKIKLLSTISHLEEWCGER